MFTDEVFVAPLTSPHVAFGPVRTLAVVFPAAAAADAAAAAADDDDDDDDDDLSSRTSMTKL